MDDIQFEHVGHAWCDGCEIYHKVFSYGNNEEYVQCGNTGYPDWDNFIIYCELGDFPSFENNAYLEYLDHIRSLRD